MGRHSRIRRGATALVSLVVASATFVAFDPSPVSADEASDAAGIKLGLAAIASSLTGYDDLGALAAPIPFSSLLPTDALGLESALDDLATKIGSSGATGINDLENFLNDPDGANGPDNDGTFAGATLDVTADISTATTPYTIVFGVSLDRPAFTEPFSIPGASGLTASGEYSVGLNADVNLAIRFDPNIAAPGTNLWVQGLNGTAGFDASADLAASGNPITVGILDAELDGSASASATANLTIVDPDDDGKVTVDEIVSSTPDDLFDANFGSSAANLALEITSSLNGLAGATGTITLADTNLANGLDTPTFNLSTFSDFQNMSPLDVLNAVAEIAASLGALQTSGLADIDLPLVDKDLSEFLDIGKPLADFLVANGLTTAENPLSIGSAPGWQVALENLDTIGELTDLLETALPGVALAYVPATKRLTFGVDLSDSGTTYPLVPDLSGQVASLGIASVDAGTSTASATPDYDLNLTFGVDLDPAAPGSAIGDRAFIVTEGTEFTLDVPVTANLDLTGLIGFVGVSLKDTNAGGSVDLISRKNDAQPMLTVDLADGPVDDGVLTVTELFDALGGGDIGSLGTVALNVEVPLFGVNASATLNGVEVVSGQFTVVWPTFPVGAPTVAADLDFNDELLDFAFDTANPLELFTRILDAADSVVTQLDTLIGANSTLTGVIPFAGTNFDAVVNRFKEIRAGIDQVIGDPASSLQLLEGELEAALGDALGISDATARASLLGFEIDTSGSAPVVIGHLDLGVCGAAGAGCTKVVPVIKPFSFAAGAGNFAGITGNGLVTLNYKASIGLDFGVQLPEVTAGFPPTVSGTPQAFILDTSSVTLSAGLDLSTTLAAKLGPVTVGLGAAGDPARLKLAADFTIANPNFGGAGVHRVPLDQIGTFLAGAVDTDISANPQVSCDGGTTLADLCAVLPIYLGNTDLGDITVTGPDLLNPAGWSVAGVDAVLAQLASEAFDWTNLVQGLQLVLDEIEKATDGQNFGAKIPVIGDALDAGADIANQFNVNVVTPLNDLITDLQAETDLTNVENEIDGFFETHLGGAGLLVDQGANGDVEDDVQVTLLCGPSSTPCVPGTDDLFDVVDMQIALSIGKTANYPLTFDLGFPGLRLAVRDNPAVTGDELVASVAWRIDLAFGISRTEGFYLRTDNPLRPGSPEITVGPSIDLPDTITGDIAFLPVTLNDVLAGPDVAFTLGADLTGGGDNKLSLVDLLNGLDPGTGITITIDGDVHLHLQLRTGLSPSEAASFGADAPKLPEFTGTFMLDWGFSAGAGTSIEAFANSDDFTIQFVDVKIDLGSLIGDFLKGILSELDKYVRPLKPVLDILNAPIPGIQQLAEFFDQEPPTMLDLIDAQNGPDSTQLIRRLIQLVNFITAVNDAPGQNPAFELGDFALKPNVVKGGALGATEAKKLIDELSLPSEIAKPLEALTSGLKDVIDDSKDEGGFTFPAFDEPTLLFQMLVGQDVDLIRFDAGKLEAKFEKTFKFGPPIGIFPVSVGATVGFGVKGHLEVGYDTRGIRNAVKVLTDGNPGNDGFFDTVATLFQGVFFDDLKDGEDVPEIALTGKVSVQAALDILVAEAGIRGGVAANLDLNLHDGGPDNPPPPENLDGKLRIEEIIQFLKGNPLCLFDTSGKFTAFLELYVDTILTSEETWTLVEGTIADFDGLFDSICNEKPALASFKEPGVLVLHVGPFSGDRNYQEGDPNETMTVRQTGPGAVTVSGYGITEDHTGVNRIFADGASGTDNLSMQSGGVVNPNGGSDPVSFTIPVELCGGPANDQLGGGGVNDILIGDGGKAGDLHCSAPAEGGGDGADSVNGGGGDDNIDGLGGNDTLNGDDGNDDVDGGSGDDRVVGHDGNDTLRGGPDASGPSDNDTVLGGRGTDTMFGGDDNDQMAGGDDGDTASGGPGDDAVFGENGVDTVNGDAGNDVVGGGNDGDTVNGGAGDDDLFGDAGNDTINGNENNDDIVGGPDNDTINGGTGRDYVVGDDGSITRPAGQADASAVVVGTGATGNDTINGDGDPDVLNGGNGDDPMNGGDGDDLMNGNAGADAMNGDAGADDMFGGDGTDTMHGNAGTDYMRGEAGADAMFGDADDDEMYGDSGADNMLGNDNVDTMRGGLDGDCMQGNGASDSMHGDAADDRMAGGSAVAGAADEGDTMFGDAGNDMMAGDNAIVCGAFTLLDIPFVGVAVDPNASGPDTMQGDDGNDTMYGQSEDDPVLLGGNGDDHIEGNAGREAIDGGANQDDIVGGSGHDEGGPSGSLRKLSNVVDDEVLVSGVEKGDDLHGGDGVDFLAGDNADMRRISGPSFHDPDGAGRSVELFEVEKVGAAPPNELTFGDDDLNGDAGNDAIFGQGDTDRIFGGAGHDYAEGNADVDVLNGDADEDDLVGGGSAADGVIDADRDGTGLLDEGDRLYGGTGADVMTGDNARIARTLSANGLVWLADPITAGHQHVVTLFDTARTAPDEVSGNDLMLGGDQRDRMFGQGGNDTVKGNNDDDFVEGNQAGDLLEGNNGEDDIIGGSRTSGFLDDGDVIHGGGGADVAIGDNGVIDRVNLSPPAYDYQTYQIGITATRFIRLLDIDSTDALVAGSDQVSGGAGVDSLFGQGKRDYIMGGTEDDYLEGNGGSDFEFGDLVRAQVAATPPPQMTGGLPGLPAGLPLENPGDLSPESPEPALSGVPGVHGQDDIVGGSSRAGLKDDGDFQYGNGAADFITGDNGTITRNIISGAYQKYVNDNPTTIVRLVVRFCTSTPTCEAAGRFGGDYQEGNDGDDYLWGQDGNDTQFGNADGDDIIGELGDDLMYGGFGEDAMVGDRGKITNTLLADNSKRVTFDTNGPAFFKYTGLIAGQRDRRVSLNDDGDGAPFPLMGLNTGGMDRMRGGPGHDSVHGAFGDDLMNGDSGGDWLFGDDGRDAMWGGRGCTPGIDPAAECTSDVSRGNNDRFVDYLIGGWGGQQSNEVLAADYLDWLPRGTPATCNEDPNDAIDSCAWHAITAPEAAADEPVYFQHFQGIDWMYGGEDRDAMMANVGKNGPDGGDRMIDWKGNYNLFTMCWASYGGDNAIRSQSPAMQKLLETLAYGSGAGATLAEVQTDNSPGERELAFVDNGPGNNGKPFPSSPGHFDDHPCDTNIPPRDK